MGLDNGLVPLGNKPLSERILTKFYVAMWHYYELSEQRVLTWYLMAKATFKSVKSALYISYKNK